jgi:uncharacterized protein YqhQ
LTSFSAAKRVVETIKTDKIETNKKRTNFLLLIILPSFQMSINPLFFHLLLFLVVPYLKVKLFLPIYIEDVNYSIFEAYIRLSL